MFLDITLKRNPELIKTAFELHREGIIHPDTYVLDLDAITLNGSVIKEEADRYGIKLYFMTKQLGRNPYIAARLMELGYSGAVAVDYKEADILYQNGVKLGHLGHLVQIPSNMIEDMLLRKPEVITVFSLEKAREISKAAQKLGINQNILLKVIDRGDVIFPGQYGGFYIGELESYAGEIMKLPNIILCGVTSFPCFLVDKETNVINETSNLSTVLKSKKLLENRFGIKLSQINTPSVTCTSSIKKIAQAGGTHGEPGHGLTGTTPLHILEDQAEIPGIVYLSEVSHNLDNSSYCYGGGYYRRSFMQKAFVGKDFSTARRIDVVTPDSDSIDYYIELKSNARVGDGAVFAFRTQIFVTRSEVAVVEGISEGKPKVVGIYDSQGRFLRSGN